jgi:hypothetical protein
MFFFALSVPLRSNNLLNPIAIGMKPNKPIANGGIAKTSNAANDEIATSNAMPRNCPIIIYVAED